MLQGALFVLICLCWGHAFAQSAQLTPEQQTRSAHIAAQLKCPVCKSQSLSASTSFMAVEMKRQIDQMVAEGKTEQEILGYFVARYSDWILLKPRKSGINWVLYSLPFVLLAMGGWFVMRLVSSESDVRQEQPIKNETKTSDSVSKQSDQVSQSATDILNRELQS